MSQVIECVPNFSEGRNQSIIDEIAKSISTTAGAKLLDVDAGKSTNRTVFTFVGSADAVVDAAFNAAAAAYKLIDMRLHTGQHPRIGAMDVCPFVPVRAATIADCVQCARRLGQRLGDELGVPVFLYGDAAEMDFRRTVPQIRSGEYEKLSERITQSAWQPNFGPAKFHAAWGATMVGARKFLIAYNVNLLGTKEQAHRIALNIREQGRGADAPGRLKMLQGIGWYLDEEKLAQISVNIIDFEVTPLHVVYEECRKDAESLQLAVAGSQIVGLVPLQALLAVAKYYSDKEGLLLLEESQQVRLAVERLGLSSVGQFDPRKRVIEYLVSPAAADGELEGQLVQMQLQRFVQAVAARTPAPGGGSVAAAVAAAAAALAKMAAQLSFGNRRFEHHSQQMGAILPPLHNAIHTLLAQIDNDTAAFGDYMQSCKQQQQQQQQQHCLRACISVPLQVARTVSSLWPCVQQLAHIVNINCKSDLQVCVKCMEAGVFGAHCNICINLENLEDEEYKRNVTEEADKLLNESEQQCKQVLEILKERKQ